MSDTWHLAGPVRVSLACHGPEPSGDLSLGRSAAPATLTETVTTLGLASDDDGPGGPPAVRLLVGRTVRLEIDLETWDEAVLARLIGLGRGRPPVNVLTAAHPDVDLAGSDSDGTPAERQIMPAGDVGRPLTIAPRVRTDPAELAAADDLPTVAVTLEGSERLWRIPVVTAVETVRPLGNAHRPLTLAIVSDTPDTAGTLWFTTAR